MHIATAAKAMTVREELEETAKPWPLTGREAAPLHENTIDELRRALGAR